ncbi:hypothetical protein EVAR_4785_1 [Eumeta japonica]|uniref:Uncharacterized protein n=1 Tax=Eumeta variegata TaxID=151549 RepID=A0A4C1T1Q3_EUMVA|nr:hypothetical protein EVAR_4785_1 [Eumeta japonica]
MSSTSTRDKGRADGRERRMGAETVHVFHPPAAAVHRARGPAALCVRGPAGKPMIDVRQRTLFRFGIILPCSSGRLIIATPVYVPYVANFKQHDFERVSDDASGAAGVDCAAGSAARRRRARRQLVLVSVGCARLHYSSGGRRHCSGWPPCKFDPLKCDRIIIILAAARPARPARAGRIYNSKWGSRKGSSSITENIAARPPNAGNRAVAYSGCGGSARCRRRTGRAGRGRGFMVPLCSKHGVLNRALARKYRMSDCALWP